MIKVQVVNIYSGRLVAHGELADVPRIGETVNYTDSVLEQRTKALVRKVQWDLDFKDTVCIHVEPVDGYIQR